MCHTQVCDRCVCAEHVDLCQVSRQVSKHELRRVKVRCMTFARRTSLRRGNARVQGGQWGNEGRKWDGAEVFSMTVGGRASDIGIAVIYMCDAVVWFDS